MIKFIYIFLISILFSCTDNKTSVKHKSDEIEGKKQHALVVKTFKNIPKEIDACACYFYLTEKDNENNNYICVNDFANLTFIFINDKLEQLELKENKSGSYYLYENNKYLLRINIDRKEDLKDEESSKIYGKLYIKAKTGQEYKSNIIGYCGC